MDTANTLNKNAMRSFYGIPLALWVLSVGMFLLNCSSVIVFTCLPFLFYKKSTIGRSVFVDRLWYLCYFPFVTGSGFQF